MLRAVSMDQPLVGQALPGHAVNKTVQAVERMPGDVAVIIDVPAKMFLAGRCER